MRKRAFFFASLLLFSVIPIYAIDADEVTELRSDEISTSQAALRTGVSLQYSPVRHLQLDFSEDLRLRNNFTTFDASYTSAQISYKINSYLRIGAAYTFLCSYEDGKKSTRYENYWQFRHRAQAFVVGGYKFGQWRLTLREMYQATFRTDLDTEVRQAEKVNPKMVLRSRLKLDYTFFSKPIKPFLSVEMHNPLNQTSYIKDMMNSDLTVANTADANYGKTFRELVRPSWLEKMQYRLGLEWRIDAHSTMEFFYMFEHTLGSDVDIKKDGARVVVTQEREYSHVIGVYYNYRF
ncbi:MAG: DUF2490 domain-containing protein [Paludibacteraceae bacterium]|nr:DUF2490 domain-containing protein [Paludibacteraceae bacterium]